MAGMTDNDSKHYAEQMLWLQAHAGTAVRAAADFEDALAAVAKTMNQPTDAIRDDFVRYVQSVPKTAHEASDDVSRMGRIPKT